MSKYNSHATAVVRPFLANCHTHFILKCMKKMICSQTSLSNGTMNLFRCFLNWFRCFYISSKIVCRSAFNRNTEMYCIILVKSSKRAILCTSKPPVKQGHECHLPTDLGTNWSSALSCGHVENHCTRKASDILCLYIRNTSRIVNHTYQHLSQWSVN